MRKWDFYLYESQLIHQNYQKKKASLLLCELQLGAAI